MIHRSKGMTLLEMMLVFAIAMSMVLLGIKQYQQYKLQGNISQAGYLVDSLLQGMSNYYFANCYHPNSFAPSPGTTTVTSPIVVDFTTSLLSAFLPSESVFILGHLPPLVSSIQTRYVPRQATSQRRAIGCASYQKVNGQTVCQWAPTSATTRAVTTLWQAQVIMTMQDPTQTLLYKGLLNADCAMDSIPKARSAPVCVTKGAPRYLLWQRLPSFASPALTSGLREFIYSTVLFTRQYTNDPMGDLYNAPGYTPANYLCGG